jgi:hypothetical protein
VRLASYLEIPVNIPGEPGNIKPASFKLYQNYPNPFNNETVIRVFLSEKVSVVLTVYDAFGRKVRTLYTGPKVKGLHRFKWDGKDSVGRSLASGVYFYELISGEERLTKKMLIIK